MPNDENSPRGFYVVAYRTSSSHKCNIVTSANCAEADLAFLMAYAHIWAESFLQIQHQCYSFPSMSQWYYQRTSISLLFSTIATFIVVNYYGYMEVLWEKKVTARARRHGECDIIKSTLISSTTQTTKAGVLCKTSKWWRVEEVCRAVNAALKHSWLALVSCHNKQDPYHQSC